LLADDLGGTGPILLWNSNPCHLRDMEPGAGSLRLLPSTDGGRPVYLRLLTVIIIALGLHIGRVSAWAKTADEMAAFHNAHLSLYDAVRIAQRQVPGGWVIDADIDIVDGRGTYTVELVKHGIHAVRVDLRDGRVTETLRRPVRPRDWKALAGVEGAPVGFLDAVAIAAKAFPYAKVVAAEMKTRLGTTRWSVTVDEDGPGIVDVDPQTGRLLRIAILLEPGRRPGKARIYGVVVAPPQP
jgi:uncharacterized membrane protein YkoI